MSPTLVKPFIKIAEKPILQQPQNIAQTKISKVPVPESSWLPDKFIPVPDYIIPETRSGDD